MRSWDRVRRRASVISIAIGISAVLSGCFGTNNGTGGESDASAGSSSGSGRGFIRVQAILKQYCVSCHLKDHSAFGDYSEIDFQNNGSGGVMYVVAGSPSESLLYTKLRGAGFGGNMPLGGNELTSGELAVIHEWITGLTPAVNEAPIVDAGSNQTVTAPGPATLDGSVSDDGLPSGSTVATTWAKASGPGTVTFASAGSVDTTATFSAAGTYVLSLTASDGALSASDSVTITVSPANAAPAVNAGADQSITLPSNANLSGSATDDGLPNPPGALTTTWAKASGPGTVTFGNASALSTTASFSVDGTYVLSLTANDGALSASDTLSVIVGANPNNAPTVNAGTDQTVNFASGAVSLSGSASDSDGPGALSVSWSKDSGPGTATFGNANAVSTTVTFSVAGTYVLRLTASDTQLTNSDTVTINANANTAPTASAGSNQTINLPTNSVNLSGSASDSDGPSAVSVTWSKVSVSPPAAASATVAFGDANATSTTATFSYPGIYTLRLRASDGATHTDSTVTITVQSAGFLAARTVFTNHCTGCHSWHTNSEASFVDGVHLVISGGVGDPASSTIYQRMSGNPSIMPPGGPVPGGDLSTIQSWISGYTAP